MIVKTQAGRGGRAGMVNKCAVDVKENHVAKRRLVFMACVALDHIYFLFLSVRASTPGNFFPSRNSREAPPPVEMCEILSATPAARTAATESPPPTIEGRPAFPETP